jgi:hypothetical protein
MAGNSQSPPASGREEQFDHLLMPIFASLLEGSHNFGVGVGRIQNLNQRSHVWEPP